MNKRVAPLVLLLLVALPLAVVAAESPEQQIRKRIDEFAAAWNRHDAQAMAAFWAPNGDLINPFGRAARGRAEIVALIQNEQATMLKQSTFKVLSATVRFVEPDIAVVDGEAEIDGILQPDGTTAPPFMIHLNNVMTKSKGTWWTYAARPVSYVKPPAAP